jgi:CRP-like cAMP-binding protein
MENEIIRATLKKSGLFCGLSDEELDPISRLCRIERFRVGDTIYKQGNLGERLYILHKGKVSLLRRFRLDDDYEAVATVYVLRERPSRRLMGCWSALIGKKHVHLCLAKCDKPTELVSLSASDLRELIDENSPLRIKILEKLILILRDRLESSYGAMETL